MAFVCMPTFYQNLPPPQIPQYAIIIDVKYGNSEPLAARMRPRTLGEVAGQEHILGPGKLLRRVIEADRLTNIILFGPPGCGKTREGAH